MDEDDIRSVAEDEAEYFWNAKIRLWYPEDKDASEYARHFINKLSELRVGRMNNERKIEEETISKESIS